PAALDPSRAGHGVRRHRHNPQRIHRNGSSALSLLQLRRRHADPPAESRGGALTPSAERLPTPGFAWAELARDGDARHRRFVTPSAVVETPVFMPVGTAETVKGLRPE